MDQRTEAVGRLNRHQPQKLRFWRCTCGHRTPCPARQLALEQLRVWNNRGREAVVMSQLRLRARIDRAAARAINQRHPWPTGPTSTWPPR